MIAVMAAARLAICGRLPGLKTLTGSARPCHALHQTSGVMSSQPQQYPAPDVPRPHHILQRQVKVCRT